MKKGLEQITQSVDKAIDLLESLKDNQKTMKIVNGFVWRIVTPEQSEVMLGHFELYELYEDGTEYLIEDIETLLTRRDQGVTIGIECGFIQM